MVTLKKNAFLKRNGPVFVVGIGVLIVFLIVIWLSQQTKNTTPKLQRVNETDLVTTETFIYGNPKAALLGVLFLNLEQEDSLKYFQKLYVTQQKNKASIKYALRFFSKNPQEFSERVAAVMAAEQQGESIDLLNLMSKYDIDSWRTYIDSLNLDINQFERDLESKEIKNKVVQEFKDASNLQVTTTTFYLNGTKVKMDTIDELTNTLNKFLNQRNTKETTESTKSDIEIPTSYLQQVNLDEPLEITFTKKDGWMPKRPEGYVGQTVIWENLSDEPIVIKQLNPKFSEFKSGVVIEPKKTFEFVLYGNGWWRYEEKDSKAWGSIYISIP